MSVQYTDGSFSDNMPIDEACEEFQRALDEGTARALFVGSEKELDRIKKKKSLEDEVEEIKNQIRELQASPVESETVIIPTRDELISVLRSSAVGTTWTPEDINKYKNW